jgi:hypothetical protein
MINKWFVLSACVAVGMLNAAQPELPEKAPSSPRSCFYEAVARGKIQSKIANIQQVPETPKVQTDGALKGLNAHKADQHEPVGGYHD